MLVGAYFDESSDELAERVYTVAGYLVPGLQGSIFELRWKSLLKKWKFDAFKASHLESGFGEFAQYRDNPLNLKAPLSKREKDLIKEIKIDFVDLICKEPDLWGYSATINLKDYARLEIQESELAARIPKPYHLCGQIVMMETGEEMRVSNEHSPAWAQGQIRPIFDSHKDYESHMLKSFESFKAKNPISSRCMLPPLYETDETYLCLQAADCLAFESRKFVDAATGLNKPDKPRKAFERLMAHVRTAFYLDYDALKRLAEVQSEPNIQLVEPTVDNRIRKKKWMRE